MSQGPSHSLLAVSYIKLANRSCRVSKTKLKLDSDCNIDCGLTMRPSIDFFFILGKRLPASLPSSRKQTGTRKQESVGKVRIETNDRRDDCAVRIRNSECLPISGLSLYPVTIIALYVLILQ